MWEIKEPTKTFGERLKYMGSEYIDEIIDSEHCIYRELPNGANFEISGANNNKIATLSMSVYVWCRTSFTIEQIHKIKSMDALKNTLEDLVAKYALFTHDELYSMRHPTPI